MHNFWRERRAEAESNWGPSAYQPNTLPLAQISSLKCKQYFIVNFVKSRESKCLSVPMPHTKSSVLSLPVTCAFATAPSSVQWSSSISARRLCFSVFIAPQVVLVYKVIWVANWRPPDHVHWLTGALLKTKAEGCKTLDQNLFNVCASLSLCCH